MSLVKAPDAAWQAAPNRGAKHTAPAALLAPAAEDVPASPLAEAASQGDVTTVLALLEEQSVDLDAPNRDGTPALH